MKDEIARVGKPSDLIQLQNLVQVLDQRYWERQSEVNRDKRNNAASAPYKSAGSSNQEKTSTASARKSTVTDKIVGTNGKLTKAERDRRFDKNLCLRCGEPNHRVKDCRNINQKPRPVAKGKASTAEATTPATSADKPVQGKE
jgi:hypothetical protein